LHQQLVLLCLAAVWSRHRTHEWEYSCLSHVAD
jgi:hypothetical protein